MLYYVKLYSISWNTTYSGDIILKHCFVSNYLLILFDGVRFSLSLDVIVPKEMLKCPEPFNN